MGNIVYDFETQLEIGQNHEDELDRFFLKWFDIIPVPLPVQKLGIDRIFERKRVPRRRSSVEYKADIKAADTKHAFIELVSNDRTGKAGWAYSSIAQELVYYVPQWRRVGVVSMLELKKNLRAWRRIHRTVECRNPDYCSKGVLVPLSELKKIMFRVFSV